MSQPETGEPRDGSRSLIEDAAQGTPVASSLEPLRDPSLDLPRPAAATPATRRLSADEVDLQRLHPISLLFRALSTVRSLILPAIAFTLFSGGGFGLASLGFLGPFLAISVASGFVSWWGLRYRLDEEELVIVRGILSRNVRRVPLSRIQNVAAVQGPLHRMLGVADARIETASGEGAEAELKVLALDEVERLRARIYARRAAAAGEGEWVGGVEGMGEEEGASDARATSSQAAPRPPRELVAVPLADLALYGLTRNRSAKILGAAAGLWWEFGQMPGVSLERWLPGGENFARVPSEWFDGERLLGFATPGTALISLLTVVGVLLVLNGLSVSWAVVQLQGFRLTRAGDDLRSVFGLLTRHSATIPRHRIQSVAIQRGWLYRRFERVSLSVETAGSDASSQSVVQRQWLSPVLSEAGLPPLLAEAQPSLDDPTTVDWQPVAARARWRLFRRRMYGMPLLLLLLWLLPFVRWWSLPLAVPLALWAWWEGGKRVAALGWALTEEALWVRRGWWNQTLVAVRPAKIQNVALEASPFDRRANMATLVVDTAGHNDPAHLIRMPYLPRATAERLRAELVARTEATAFRW